MVGGEGDRKVRGILKDYPHQRCRLDEHPSSPGHDLDRDVHHCPLFSHPVSGKGAAPVDLDLLEDDRHLHGGRILGPCFPHPGGRGRDRPCILTRGKRESPGGVVPRDEDDSQEEDVHDE